jgi:hypothetical protein
LGFCYGETNRHAEALEIGRSLESSYTSESPIHALGRLIQVVNLFAIGQKTEAGRMHAEIRSDPRLFSTPLFGYALRFTELLENFPECTTDVLQSVDHFDSYGMSASAAYSALSGAMHLAYAGDISQASTQIERAKQFLEREVRDLHILFNNEVVINLLSDKPNFDTCITTLDRAAYSVKDEFYRAVIENNRLICRWSLGKVEDAKHSVALLEEAMRNPGFGNRDVFWTFTYNCWAFLREIGDGARAEAFLEELNGVKVEQLDYEDYWHFRFGRATRPPARYDHLLKFKYHPEYLSHWIVDVDAMRDGRAGQLS